MGFPVGCLILSGCFNGTPGSPEKAPESVLTSLHTLGLGTSPPPRSNSWIIIGFYIALNRTPYYRLLLGGGSTQR